ncbi:hypothetical protein GCM10008985_04480 [Halococcus dombrowskii]|uniref:Uncharacterized protein n=1 Tax=Halococcus dombrowskii TaxID=179637 RepID=A0AAV3SCR5_HALDO
MSTGTIPDATPLTQSILKPVAISLSTNETVSTDDAKLARDLESG